MPVESGIGNPQHWHGHGHRLRRFSRYNRFMQSPISDEIADQEIRKAIGFLSHWPGVRRIWLFGSAAKGRRLDWRSDLGFAVEGMASIERYRAWAELDER